MYGVSSLSDPSPCCRTSSFKVTLQAVGDDLCYTESHTVYLYSINRIVMVNFSQSMRRAVHVLSLYSNYSPVPMSRGRQFTIYHVFWLKSIRSWGPEFTRKGYDSGEKNPLDRLHG